MLSTSLAAWSKTHWQQLKGRLGKRRLRARFIHAIEGAYLTAPISIMRLYKEKGPPIGGPAERV